MRTLQSVGWTWHENGVLVSAVVDGVRVELFVPVAEVQVMFGRELARVGCPLCATVAGPPTVSGFFDSIKSAYKSATRVVKKAVPKAISRAVSTVANQAKSIAKDAVNVASRTVRDPRQLALALATGGASAIGQTAASRHVLSLARHVPGPIGTAAGVMRTANSAMGNIAQRKGVNFAGLVSDLAEAGASYVPGGGHLARGALSTAAALARGQSIDDAVLRGATDVASRYVPRQALTAAVDIARGERVDKTLKNALLRQVSVPGLSRIVPTPAALAEAGRAWSRLHDGHEAVRRLQSGRAMPGDFDRARFGHVTRSAVERTRDMAMNGNPQARQLLGAFRRVGGCL